jgi:hypothetical protein
MNDIKSRIAAACANTAPRTKARNLALAAVRWVIKSEQGNAYIGQAGLSSVLVAREHATVFDGRDNEEMKIAFLRAITADYSLTIELAA